MDQSKSNKNAEPVSSGTVEMPQRTFTVEFIVGVFTLIAALCGGYLSVKLGDIQILGSDRYEMFAEFDNVSGLKDGASVSICRR